MAKNRWIFTVCGWVRNDICCSRFGLLEVINVIWVFIRKVYASLLCLPVSLLVSLQLFIFSPPTVLVYPSLIYYASHLVTV